MPPRRPRFFDGRALVLAICNMSDTEQAIRVREIARHDARLAARIAQTLFLTQGKE
jgi:hypothetical protein